MSKAKLKRHGPKNGHKNGFTLIEVLIAMVIMVGGILVISNAWSGNFVRCGLMTAGRGWKFPEASTVRRWSAHPPPWNCFNARGGWRGLWASG